ncbi:TPA: hypothetical protein N0F65_003601 [Lagenidium giganteum]|uniref:Uncharacterized protein n=1 Tax=Lagenidium giganteum TaxID=4803 RepID=A0AAV2Z5F2_9STRA|nr:TPA: hypothetical protein N0F65_003601 [Lagenidium giganteum]
MPGEIRHDLDYHSDKAGGSVWSWIKDKAYPWLKQNIWPVVKPIVSGFVDQGANALGAYTGQPGIVNAVRKEVAAKNRMAELRSKRKTGGSFKL